MSESKLNSTFGSFHLIGKAIISDKTFSIDNMNKSNTWQYSHVSMGINCGEKYGTIFIEKMGGHNPKESSVKYCSTKNEDGTIKKGKENQISISWENRFDEIDFNKVSDSQMFKTGFRDAEGKIEQKTFVFEEDFIKYIAENVKNDDVVSVRGHLEYYRDPETGDVSVKKVVDHFFLSNVKEEHFKANFELQAYVDSGTFGKLNREDNNVALYFKVASFVNKINDKKYNQVGCYSIKVIWNLKNFDLTKTEDQKKIVAQTQKFFKPEKNMVHLITIGGHFVEGAGITEVKPEDFSKEIQNALESGLLSMDELTGTALNGKSRTKEMYYDTVKTYLEDNTVHFHFTENIMKEEDLVFVQDLQPIEDSAPSSTSNSETTNAEDAEPDEISSDLMAELFGGIS